MNLAILQRWKEGNIRILFWDPDEYLHVRPQMLDALKLKLQNHGVVSFQRKSTICADCGLLPEISLPNIENRKFKMSERHIPAKVALNPNAAGCMFVHFSLCDRHSMIRLDSRIAFVVHFENLLEHRVDQNKIGFVPADLSILDRCHKMNLTIGSLQEATYVYEVTVRESSILHANTIITNYFEYEKTIILALIVFLSVLLLRFCWLRRFPRKD
jgi:hypothetical protein